VDADASAPNPLVAGATPNAFLAVDADEAPNPPVAGAALNAAKGLLPAVGAAKLLNAPPLAGALVKARGHEGALPKADGCPNAGVDVEPNVGVVLAPCTKGLAPIPIPDVRPNATVDEPAPEPKVLPPPNADSWPKAVSVVVEVGAVGVGVPKDAGGATTGARPNGAAAVGAPNVVEPPEADPKGLASPNAACSGALQPNIEEPEVVDVAAGTVGAPNAPVAFAVGFIGATGGGATSAPPKRPPKGAAAGVAETDWKKTTFDASCGRLL